MRSKLKRLDQYDVQDDSFSDLEAEAVVDSEGSEGQDRGYEVESSWDRLEEEEEEEASAEPSLTNGCTTVGLVHYADQFTSMKRGPRRFSIAKDSVPDENQLENLKRIGKDPGKFGVPVFVDPRSPLPDICIGEPFIIRITGFFTNFTSQSQTNLPSIVCTLEQVNSDADSDFSQDFRVLHILRRSGAGLNDLEICFELQMSGYLFCEAYKKYLFKIALRMNELDYGADFETQILPAKMIRIPRMFILKHLGTLEGSMENNLFLVTTENNKRIKLPSDSDFPMKHAVCRVPSDLPDGVYDVVCKASKSFGKSNSTGHTLLNKLISLNNLRGDSYRILYERNSDPHYSLSQKSIKAVVSWQGDSPGHLDLHVISSAGDHFCYYNGSDGKGNVVIDCSSSAEASNRYGGNGWGPCSATINQLEANTSYLFYAENVPARWSDFQNKFYSGKSLAESGAVCQIHDSVGVLLDHMRIPFFEQSTSGFFWEMFSINSATGVISIHNRIVEEAPSLTSRKSLGKRSSSYDNHRSESLLKKARY